jgi:hypothetical protein
VYGHQDKHKTWQQMNLLDRLNFKCDSLAKWAVSLGIIECPQVVSTSRQRLPLESVAIFHNGVKISGECGKEIRFHIGKVEAREFYINQLGWYAAEFYNVDWESQDRALDGKPDMFKMWLFKQTLSFCATGRNMGRWFGSEHTACPNCNAPEDADHLLHCQDSGRFSLFCSEVNKLAQWLQQSHTDPTLTLSFCATGRNMGRWFGSEHTACPNCNAPDEDADHLLHCQDSGRFSLFCSEVNKLAQWLQQSHTDPTLAIILVEYTLARGDKKLCDMSLRQEFHKFAYTQDLFGWDQYMLGKISKHIRPIQYRHLLESPSMLTVDDWMKQAINQLLHIVHGQWIYRNTSKHHETLGSIRMTKRMQLLLEIDRRRMCQRKVNFFWKLILHGCKQGK